jgi:hypothetical protein
MIDGVQRYINFFLVGFLGDFAVRFFFKSRNVAEDFGSYMFYLRLLNPFRVILKFSRILAVDAKALCSK